MTDRCNFITVALSGDLPEDDVKPLVDAILMIRGVIGAEANVADSGSWTARMQARQLLIDQLWTVLKVVPLILTLLFAAGFVATARAEDRHQQWRDGSFYLPTSGCIGGYDSSGGCPARSAQAADVHNGSTAYGCIGIGSEGVGHSIPCPDGSIEGELTLGQVRELQIALSSIERREGTCDGKPCSIPVPTCLGDIKPPCIPLAISAVIADDLAGLAPQWQFYQTQAHKLIGEASGGSGYVAPGSKEEVIANYRLFDLNGQKVSVKMRQIDVHGLEASGVQLPPSIKAVLSPISR
jgi:hypothetical protein